MTWTATGSWLSAHATTLAVNNQAAGNLLLVGVLNTSNNTVWCTGLSGGGATWTPLGVKFSISVFGFPEYATLFAGTVTATGAGTVTPSWSGTTPGSYYLDGHEFHSSSGSWTLDVQGNLDSASTANWASLTPAANGELYFGFEDNAGSAVVGSTSGYAYNLNPSGLAQAYNLNCPSGVATFPVWGDTDARAGIMVLVQETAAVAPPVQVLAPAVPPGWFPGADKVTTEPGGIPFALPPGTTDATPGVIIPPAPEVAGYQGPRLPPGWFPGSAAVTQDPGGIPFYPEPTPFTAPAAVVFPVPEVAGIADWLPLPPGYFPGSQAVAVDPGGIPFYSQPLPLTPPDAVIKLYPPYIAGVTASTSTQGGCLTDQHGSPRLWVCDQNYGIFSNAGRWNGSGGGTYQQDFDNYCSQRAAQGVTALLIEPIGTPANASVFANGNTWDNVSPWINGTDATGGLNPAYWTRLDYLLNSALSQGITVYPVFDIFYCTTPGGGAAFNGWTNAQYLAYGTALGARYKNQPNLMWLFGDDTFPTSFDTFFDNILTGLQNSGDAHLVSAFWMSEMTSRYATDTNIASAWGTAHSAFNSCYTYNAGYWIIEYAYGEVANQGATSLLPVVWNDGMHYNGAGASYDSTWDRSIRQECWWCLTAGARGITTYDVHNYIWNSGANAATVTSAWFFANNLNNIVTYYSGLTGWNNLLPDLSSAFVTAGRGTRVSGIAAGNAGAAYEASFTNSWVTASITPDGTLAVCYLPNSTTITVNATRLATGWTASWIDPVTCAASSAGSGPTFNSTAKGTNSQGDPDWVLIFQAPPVTVPADPGLPVYQPLPPGWFPGSQAVTAEPGGIPFYSQPQPAGQNAAAVAGTFTGTAGIAGAGAVTAVVTQDAGTSAAAAGAGAVSAVATQIAPAAAAGAGSATDVVTQIATATAAGAGSVTAAATQIAAAAAAGAGAVTDVVTQAVIASAAGAGSVTAAATEIAPATAAGAGSVTDAVTQIATASAAAAASVTAAGSSSGAATATAAGAASVTAVATQIAPATAAGAAAVSDAATQAAGAAAAAAGSVTAVATQIAPASPAGAAAVSDVVTQVVTGSAAGAGSVTAAGTSSGAATASSAGAAAVTAVVTQAATATAPGAGAAAAAATQIAKATAAGAGSVTAAGQITGAASVAGAAAATAKAAQGTAATAAGAAALSALAAQRATAAISGAGSVIAAGNIQVAFTVGTLTAADKPLAVLAASTAAATGTATLTAATTTGGPS